LKLQSDDKEHHDHPELGEMHHILPFSANESEGVRSNDDARDEVAQNRSQAEFFG